MTRTLRSVLPLLLLLAVSPPLFGHLAFNLVVDEHSNIYFIDVFKSALVKVSPGGEHSVLADLRTVGPDRRLHSMVLGKDGDLYIGGYNRRKIWRVSPAGEVFGLDLSKETKPASRGVLHLGFDASAALYVVEWTYGAPREDQRFIIQRFQDLQEAPAVLFVSHGGENDFLDFHLGSMIVAGDGTIYFSNTHGIWKLGSGRRMSLVAGGPDRGFVDGVREAAQFDSPHGMSMHPDGSILVAERSGRIRRVSPQGQVTTLAGTRDRGHKDGTLSEARFAEAFAVAVGPQGHVYVAEYEDKREYRIRVIREGRVTTLARIPSDGVFVK